MYVTLQGLTIEVQNMILINFLQTILIHDQKMVMRINKIITYMKMICFSNKFLQLIFIKEMYGEHLKEF